MVKTAHAHSELKKAICVLLYGEPDDSLLSPEDRIAELPIMLACVAALDHDEQYLIYDTEDPDSEVPDWVNTLPEEKIASWSGMDPESSGYGWIDRVVTQGGVGLGITLGGSMLQSATGFWIIPARALGYYEQE
jgi:hypothetical protein